MSLSKARVRGLLGGLSDKRLYLVMKAAALLKAAAHQADTPNPTTHANAVNQVEHPSRRTCRDTLPPNARLLVLARLRMHARLV
jgi:hypothetical protein